MKNIVLKVFPFVFACCIFILFLNGCTNKKVKYTEVKKERPKIVNIINFIRLLEPRDAAITEDVLFQTVVKQV